MLITYPDQCPDEIVFHLQQMGFDAAAAKEFWKEYRERDAREWAAAVAEQHLVSRQNFTANLRPVEGLGQCMFRIGAKMQAYLWKHYKDEIYTPQFQRDLIRHHPEFFFAPTVLKLARIVKTRHLS